MALHARRMTVDTLCRGEARTQQGQTMVELLSLQQELVPEDSILETVVLETLRRPQSQAISLREITRELANNYDPSEVEQCLIRLSEQGLVELVYTSGYDLGIRTKPRTNGSTPAALNAKHTAGAAKSNVYPRAPVILPQCPRKTVRRSEGPTVAYARHAGKMECYCGWEAIPEHSTSARTASTWAPS